MEQQLTFRRRLASIVGLLIFLWSCLLMGGIAYWALSLTRENNNSHMEARLEAIAASTATLIDGDIHNRLIASGDETDPDYQSLTRKFRQVQSANNRKGDGSITRIFTFWRDPADRNVPRIGLDTGIGADHHPLNSIHKGLFADAALAAFKSGIVQSDSVIEGSSSTLKTAYAPIRDSNGTIVAVVGVELETPVTPLISYEQIYIALIIIVVSTLFGMLFALLTSPSIIRPLNHLADVAQKIGGGDLRVKPDSARLPKEFSGLAGGFQHMLDNLKRLVGHIRGSADNLNSWSQDLMASTENAGRAANEVAAMLSELAASTDTISKSTTDIAREFEEVDRLAGTFADQALAMNDGMSENRKRADRGLVAVREAVEQVLSFAHLLKDAASQVNSFRMWSSQIGETAGYIAGLAEQTNILAMNAQIEAARAGAAGTGFKVVAIKISEMAENTTKFAERIAQVNKDLQQHLEQVSTAVNTTDRRMAESTSLMEEAGRLFTQIADNIRQMASIVASISTTAQNLKTRTDQGRRETGNIADIMEVTAGNIEQISAGSEEQAALSAEVEQAAKRLSELARQLAAEVAQFKA